MAEYSQIGIELLIGFIALFFMTKILGRTEITQITTFDFISALVLGELVGNALYDDKIKIPKVLFAVFLWGLLIYLLEFITQKFKRTRKPLEGEPSIVIHKGKLSKETMKKNKLDINQLQHLVRKKDIFSLRDVEYAILETDGSVSVLKKSQADTPSRQDLNLPQQNVTLPITLIIDGELLPDNLASIHQNEEWLLNQLAAFGIQKIEDVFYADFEEGSGIYVSPYNY